MLILLGAVYLTLHIKVELEQTFIQLIVKDKKRRRSVGLQITEMVQEMSIAEEVEQEFFFKDEVERL